MTMNKTSTTAQLLPSSFLALLVASLSGADFLSLPHDAAKMMGPSGYWGVLVAGIYALALIGLIVLIKRRFPNQNIIKTSCDVLGKPIGALGNLFFMAIFLGWLMIGIRDASELVLTYLLVRTPLWVVEVFFLICFGYIATHGLTAVSRMASFIVLPTISLRFLMTMLSYQDFAVSHIEPIFSAQPAAYFHGGLFLAHAFLSLGIILMIYPQLTKEKKLVPITLGALGTTVILFLSTVVGNIGVFGAPLTSRFAWPNLAMVHRISIPYLILEQVGLLFLIVWLTLFLIPATLFFTSIAGGLQQQFPKLNFRWTVLGLLVLVGTFGLLIPNGATVNRLFDLFRYWIFVPVTAYPLLIYLIALLRGMKKA